MGRKPTTFFISDIHGCYNEMIILLQTAKYKPGVDTLIVGGDMIDRGPDSALVLRQIRSLELRYPEHVKVLIGNHEEMMLWHVIQKPEVESMWLQHGGDIAADNMMEHFDQAELDATIRWATTRPHIYWDDEFVYVHAGLDAREYYQHQDRDQCIWMPYTSPRVEFYNHFTKEDILRCTDGRKVVHGHTPRSYIFDDGARICCDGGAAVKPDGRLNLVDLKNDYYYHIGVGETIPNLKKIARKKVTV